MFDKLRDIRASLMSALKDVVTLNFVPTDTASMRMTICNDCPAKDHDRKICTACGCYLPWKVKLKNAQCPMENWEK